MSKKLLAAGVAVLLLVVLIQGIALWMTPSGAPEQRVPPEAVVQALAPFGEATDVTYVPAADLYRARIGGQILYITPDGRHALAGDLYDLTNRVNLTRQAQSEDRQKVLAGLDPASAITFSPAGETKDVVWVFTDPTCPYCQKFHEHIDAYTERGIEVRYLAYPRAGPGSKAWKLTEAVWCAQDPKAALGKAKGSGDVAAEACPNNPVAAQYQAGQAVGLTGTPMILTSSGEILGGYLGPEQLAARLAGEPPS